MVITGLSRYVNERKLGIVDDRRQLFHHQPAASRLKSRKSLMCTFTPLDSSASSSRLQLWKDSLTDVLSSVKMGLRRPSLCRLDLERTGSVDELLKGHCIEFGVV